MFHWTDLSKLRAVLDVNLVAVFAVTKHLLPQLIKARGRVVNIASLAGYVPLFGASAYTASKHGVVGFSNAIRAELYPLGVDVIHIAPGFMKTPLVENIGVDIQKTFEALPEEVRALYPANAGTKIATDFSKDVQMVVRAICSFVFFQNCSYLFVHFPL